MSKKNTKAALAYPRALVHINSTGSWALAWRYHPDTGNHWDLPMSVVHYPEDSLAQACDHARAMVDHAWDNLGQVSA